MKKRFLVFWGMILAVFCASAVYAHTPVLLCQEDDGQCECRGLFSDMSSAAGADILVKNDAGKVVLKGKLDEDGEWSFSVPEFHYTVTMNAGAGHVSEPWDPEDSE